jgi:hypothetical protein
VLVKNEYCRLATIRFRLSIHVPFAQGGEMCQEVFTTVADCLTFGSNLNILDSGCNGMAADRDAEAFVLPAWIRVAADFCPATGNSLTFASFLNKELLCGSHISNQTIHVTPEEKSRIAQPFCTGQYRGNGGTKTVDIGFEPTAVLVFASAHAPFSSTGNKAHFGLAVSDKGLADNHTLGLETVLSGFRVTSSGTAKEGSVPALNDPGQNYIYIAFP